MLCLVLILCFCFCCYGGGGVGGQPAQAASIRGRATTRWCGGVLQSFQQELLEACGRAHGLQDVEAAVQHLAAAGVDNWSMDLISGAQRGAGCVQLAARALCLVWLVWQLFLHCAWCGRCGSSCAVLGVVGVPVVYGVLGVAMV